MSRDQFLQDSPFSYQATKNGLVQIFCDGKVVTRLSGANAQRLLVKLESAGESEQQLLMARATGHFKQGNEKVAKRRRDNR